MSSQLDEFYRNFPLTFVGRDPQKHQFSNLPSSVNEARDQILRKSWNCGNPKKIDRQAQCANQFYLYATGNFRNETTVDDDPSQKVRLLENTHRINESSCGFISDIDIKQRREIIKMSNNDLENASFHEIFRFCFAHGMYIGHDIDLEELKSMARWIIRNENDGVTFAHFSSLMQQAIDMSVLAQYAPQIGPESDSETREHLDQLSDQALSATMDMEKQSSFALHEAGLLLRAANEVCERKPIADFQSKVLHSHIESQMKIEEKIEKGSLSHSNSSNQQSQPNSQNQEENANDN